MTVRELIETLNEYDDDMIVRFAFDYGDLSHTHIAREVTNVNIEQVRHNSYVNEIALADLRYDDEKDTEEALVLT